MSRAKGYRLAILAGPKLTNAPGWVYNLWHCQIVEKASGLQVWAGEFRTGLAIQRPTLDDVFAALLSDANCVSDAETIEGFADFADEYGFEDRRKAIEAYRACGHIRRVLLAFLKLDELERLTELYQDY